MTISFFHQYFIHQESCSCKIFYFLQNRRAAQKILEIPLRMVDKNPDLNYYFFSISFSDAIINSCSFQKSFKSKFSNLKNFNQSISFDFGWVYLNVVYYNFDLNFLICAAQIVICFLESAEDFVMINRLLKFKHVSSVVITFLF